MRNNRTTDRSQILITDTLGCTVSIAASRFRSSWNLYPRLIRFSKIFEEGKILNQILFGSENPEVQPERPLVSQSTLCKITKLSVGQIRYRVDQFKIHGCR